ncbi:unnamed protein product [Prunus armeniaca]|uniref:Uncharacterized protein n=1 Tax=Prunus armeniaca TaxID=36596 RepID=A0A6J5U102_PRUAR|nr:unnamed protein product [Prunus armeniaca]
MVNTNFPRPDQPRPRLDLGGSAKVVAERRAREIPADPEARVKAKMYPEVTKVLETKFSTKEEPSKAQNSHWYHLQGGVRIGGQKASST